MAYPARIGLALFVCLFISVSAAGAGQNGPSALVARFQDALLQTMREAKALGLNQRYVRLQPLIRDIFHLPLMVATASAPYWRRGSPEDRKALLGAFERMSVSSVATLFDDYDNETFEVVRARESRGPIALVDTRINRPDDDPVEITYVTANLKGRWWIIDIIVGGGISEIKVRRAEYLSLLEHGGLPNLTRALSEKADRLLAGKEKAGPGGR